MNILLITELYPTTPEETIATTSFAIRNLLRDIEKMGINIKKIIIPLPLIKWKRMEISKESKAIIEGIAVETKVFFKVPKSRKYLGVKKKYFRKEVENIDLVIAHMAVGGYLANKIYKNFKVPYIYVLHNTDLKSLKKQKEILKNSNGIYTRSWAMKEKVEKKHIKVNGVIFSGIEENKIIKTIKPKEKNRTFITVSKLIKLKNIENNLKAFSLLPSNFKWEYLIIGDGPEKEKILKLIKKFRLEKKVKMLGFMEREKCIEYMKKSDIFVMVSAPETFGLVYLEAMASGCIVICSKGWGIDGFIKNGINGFTANPNNILELRDIFLKILKGNIINMKKKSLNSIKKLTEKKAQENYVEIIKKNGGGL